MIGKRLILFLWLLLSLSFSLYAKGPQKPSCLLQNLTLLANLKTGHLARHPEKYTDLIAKKNKELEGLAYEGIIPWGPKKRDAIKRFMIEKFGMDKWAQDLPAFDKNQKLGKAVVDIDEIHWSQINARNMSQDGKYTVIDNAKSFKAGTLKVEQLPAVRVWRDVQGRVWTLDHRRLAAMRLSGVIKNVPVEFVDEATVKAQQFKFGTHNDGASLFVWLDDVQKEGDLAIVLVNKGSQKVTKTAVDVKEEIDATRNVSKIGLTTDYDNGKNPLVTPNLKTGHLGDIEKFEPLILKTEKEIDHLNHQGVIPWGPKSRDAVKRFFIEKFKMNFMAQKLPTYNKSQTLGKAQVKVTDIRFSQIRCRNSSQDGKYSVLGNAKDLQSGKLKVEMLPTLRVWRDTEGRIWTLDHRRLAAIRLAGNIENITVEFVDEATVIAQRFKFDTLDEGKSMFVWLDDAKKETELSVVIAPDNKLRNFAGAKAGKK